MTWHLAVGFILGTAITTTAFYLSTEFESAKSNNHEQLISELLEENKAYKKAYQSFNEDRNPDNWG